MKAHLIPVIALLALATAGCTEQANEAEMIARPRCQELVNDGDYFPGLTQSLEGCEHGVHIAAIAARRNAQAFIDPARIERMRAGLARQCELDGVTTGDPEYAPSCIQGVGLFEEEYRKVLVRDRRAAPRTGIADPVCRPGRRC